MPRLPTLAVALPSSPPKSRAGPQWPFAYDGLLAFWLVAIDFFLWMVVMSVVMLQVLARDERRIKPAN